MLFQQPAALWALFLLLIPVLLHLFQLQRPKTLIFSDLRFLKEVVREQQRKRKLRDFLLLLSRLLAVAALVLAFARPYLPAGEPAAGAANRSIAVVLDNSASSGFRWEGSRFLEVLQSKTLALLKSLPPETRIRLITADASAGRPLTIREAEEQVAALRVSPVPLQKDMLMKNLQRPPFDSGEWEVFFFSDFQLAAFPPEPIQLPGLRFNLIPVAAVDELPNLSLDSAWFARPVFLAGEDQQLNVRIRNYTGREYPSLPVELHMNGQVKSIATANLPENGLAEVELSFRVPETGTHALQLQINDGSFATDDRLHTSFRVTENIPVVLLHNNPASPLHRIFSAPPFDLLAMEPGRTDPAAITSAKALVVHAPGALDEGTLTQLRQALEAGATLIYFPSGEPKEDLPVFRALSGVEPDLDTVNDLGKELHQELPLFAGMFQRKQNNPNLPRTNWHYRWPGGALSAWDLSNGDPFYFSRRAGRGTLWISAGGLEPEAGNWGSHALLLPVVCQSIFTGLSAPQPYTVLGTSRAWPTLVSALAGDRPLGIGLPEGVSFPSQRSSRTGEVSFDPLPELPEPGTYPLIRNADTLGLISLNQSRLESDPRFSSEPDPAYWGENAKVWEAGGETLTAAFERERNGVPLWHWFLGAVLLFLALEGLILRMK